MFPSIRAHLPEAGNAGCCDGNILSLSKRAYPDLGITCPAVEEGGTSSSFSIDNGLLRHCEGKGGWRCCEAGRSAGSVTHTQTQSGCYFKRWWSQLKGEPRGRACTGEPAAESGVNTNPTLDYCKIGRTVRAAGTAERALRPGSGARSSAPADPSSTGPW